MKILMIIAVIMILVGGGMFVLQNMQERSATTTEATPIPTLAPSPTPVPRMISILNPVENTTLVLGKTATVSGQATGLFEGTVVIRLTDSKGKVVVDTPIIAQDWMQTAPVDWTTQITVPATASAGMALLTAINPSVKDASEDVSDTITVELSKKAATSSAAVKQN